MKKVAFVLATVTALGLISHATHPAYAYDPGYSWGGYALDHYRDYAPIGTYDGYIPASYVERTTYNDPPVYLGYRYRIVAHPANYGGPGTIRHHRRHW
jgi:hypothetical protein